MISTKDGELLGLAIQFEPGVGRKRQMALRAQHYLHFELALAAAVVVAQAELRAYLVHNHRYIPLGYVGIYNIRGRPKLDGITVLNVPERQPRLPFQKIVLKNLLQKQTALQDGAVVTVGENGIGVCLAQPSEIGGLVFRSREQGKFEGVLGVNTPNAQPQNTYDKNFER